jgi:hypothetical protein
VFLGKWRKLACGILIVAAPALISAQSTERAILHNNGGTSLNKSPAPDTSAIFPDYLIETEKGHIATIDADGSSVTVQPETVVQFEVDELDLDHGFLQLTTSRELKVRVNCLTVIPVTTDRTQYDVINIDGKVKVIAHQNDVRIHAKESVGRKATQGESSPGRPTGRSSGRSSDVIVREGHESTRDEHCGAAAKATDGVAAKGAIFNSVWAKGAGLGGIGLLCILLCRSDDPISPSWP